MTDETMGLDEVFDDLEVEGPETDDFDSDEDEIPAPETPEPEVEEPATTPEATEDVYAKFAQSRNPHDLPDGPIKDQMLNLQRWGTKAAQEASELRNAIPAPEPRPEPKLDLEAEPDELVKQIDALVNYKVAQAVAPTRVVGREMGNMIHQQRQNDRVSRLENHVMGLPGYTDEIGQKMVEFLGPKMNDPQWGPIVTSEGGLEMVFERVKSGMTAAGNQDAMAASATQKANSPVRGRTSKARPKTETEKYGDMPTEAAVGAIIDDEVARYFNR